MFATDRSNIACWSARLSIAACLLLSIGIFHSVAAQCPPSGRIAWPAGSTIRYYIDFHLPDTAQSQIRSAMDEWTTANVTNGSRVTFVEEPNPGMSTTSLTFEPGENPVTFPDGTTGWAAARTHKDVGPDGNLRTATVTIDASTRAGVDTTPGANGLDTIFEKLGLHETGHTMGLDHVTGGEEGGMTVMNNGVQMNDSWNNMPTTVKPCDENAVEADPHWNPPQPTPTPTPTPSCPDWCPNLYAYPPAQCFGPTDWCAFPDNGCDGDLEPNGRCCCVANTPILIDLLGNGFSLTDFESGVSFDLVASGVPSQTSWTQGNSDDAFLALDRNGNGVIDNGAELFGNATVQPQPPRGFARNGFQALAEYDKPANGGNLDGIIDSRDAVYGSLRLWRDLNHNGVSEPAELSRLIDWGVESISLELKESRRRDEFGNGFRYRSRVAGSNVGKWTYDVILQSRPR